LMVESIAFRHIDWIVFFSIWVLKPDNELFYKHVIYSECSSSSLYTFLLNTLSIKP
jgi:hypothetical protein